jgi:hypothetical protein
MEEHGKRIFTFDEARGLLPQVRETTRRALERISELQGSVADDEDPEEGDERIEREAGEVLHAWAHEIESLGIEVKGPWLVDFDSGAGYYCWKWPEDSLEFFHSYEEGFAGRVRLQ